MPRSAPGSVHTIGVDLRALVAVPTGIGVYTLALLRELVARGEHRYLGLAHRPPHGAAEIEALGVAIETRPAPLGVLWQQWHLPRRLAAGDVSLLWSPINTLPLSSPVPAVVTVHDLTPLLLPQLHSLRGRWSAVPFLRSTMRRARRIVAVSEATAADLRRCFPSCADRVRVVLSGVDARFEPATAAAIAATRIALGAPDGYLLYAGTLEPRKNLPRLLDAWEAARRADPRFPPLLLAGPEGWKARDLMRRLRDLQGSGVKLLGRLPQPELVATMQAARVFVYPSLYEGFGLPPLEAMACGVPVVTSSSSSLPEVVGDAGLLVEPQDTKALAAALVRLVGDPALAADLGARGRERSQSFRWSQTAARMDEVFAEALQ